MCFLNVHSIDFRFVQEKLRVESLFLFLYRGCLRFKLISTS